MTRVIHDLPPVRYIPPVRHGAACLALKLIVVALTGFFAACLVTECSGCSHPVPARAPAPLLTPLQ